MTQKSVLVTWSNVPAELSQIDGARLVHDGVDVDVEGLGLHDGGHLVDAGHAVAQFADLALTEQRFHAL